MLLLCAIPWCPLSGHTSPVRVQGSAIVLARVNAGGEGSWSQAPRGWVGDRGSEVLGSPFPESGTRQRPSFQRTEQEDFSPQSMQQVSAITLHSTLHPHTARLLQKY